MTKKSLRVPEHLSHILVAIELIQRYTEGKDQTAFLEDELLQDAVIRNIEKHGPGFIAEHEEVPWAALYAMRNRVSHGYWSVDLDAVWQVVQRDLAVLDVQIRTLLSTGAGRDVGSSQ